MFCVSCDSEDSNPIYAARPITANSAHSAHSGVLLRSLLTIWSGRSACGAKPLLLPWMCALFAVIGLAAYIGLESSLSRDTQNTLAGYSDLVKLAPRPAHVTITLP